MICPYFRHSREKYIKPYYYTRPSVIKFEKLLCSSSKKKLSNLGKFARIILKQFECRTAFVLLDTYFKYILYLATVCTNASVFIVILQVYYLHKYVPYLYQLY